MTAIIPATNIHLNNIHSINLSTSHPALKFLQINIRGINNVDKLDSFCVFLRDLSINVDVLVIGETWIKDERAPFYNIPGYKSIHSCRKHSSGGLAIFVRNGVTFSLEKNIVENGYHHIELLLNARHQRVSLHGIYRPPDFEINRFVGFMEEILSATKPNQPCFVLGDMNVPINNPLHRGVQNYSQLLTAYNMIVTNTHVTRPLSNNVLDHVVCSIDLSSLVTNYTIDCPLSDHSYVLTIFKTKTAHEKRTLTKKLTNQRLVCEQFEAFLQEATFDVLPPNDRLAAITNKYKELVDNNTRVLSIEVTVKSDCCPWLDFDVWRMSRIKDNVYQRYKHNRDDPELVDMLHHVDRLLSSYKRKAKIKYYERRLNTSNGKVMWKHINEILGKTSKQDTGIKLTVNHLEVHDPKEVADCLNRFFVSVGDNLAARLSSDGDVNRHNTMIGSSRSIFLRPSSTAEVKAIILTLNVNKATGFDEFPVAAIRNHRELLAPMLSNCFNDCVSAGIYPDCLKKALVFPIYKKGDASDPSNYRPISVLPAINKVFEKLIYARLENFFSSTEMLYKHQFGFRHGSSTEIAVLELVDELSAAIDTKLIAGSVFLDLSKAFDTINHSMLLKKLDVYGVRGLANEFVRSYLTNRQQQVVVSGARSDLLGINSGVPQGSNIGPMLFLIYVNDLANLPLYGKPRLFADDTVLSYEDADPVEIIQNMRSDLHNVLKYLENNLLALNLEKTKLMMFRSPRAILPDYPELSISGEVVEEVSSFKYLGVFLDNKLNWSTHISELISGCSSLCGMLRKLSWTIPQKILLNMYYAFIQSRYQYAISAWGNANRTDLKELQTQQNRCIKAIFKLPFLHPTRDLYSMPQHTILPIVGLHRLQTAVIMFKIRRNTGVHHNWSFTNALHRHSTRQASNIVRVSFRTEIGRRRFSISGPTIYNSIPERIRHLPTLGLFKKNLKELMRENLEGIILR